MISSTPADRFCVETARDQPIGVLASGGLDSSILVARLVAEGARVQPLYVKSDLCWQREEYRALRRFLERIRSPRLSSLVTLKMPMADLYQDHWSVTRRDTPRADSADEAVYLPGRNALLAIKAALWCQLNGIRYLALATLGTSPFADTTESFFASFQSVVNLPGTPPLKLVAPLGRMVKEEVMRWGRDYPLHLTFSCIAPESGRHCGRCNKCAERQWAFRQAGLADRSKYVERLVADG
jgi:7-cyano-7-deazaguanine synthase